MLRRDAITVGAALLLAASACGDDGSVEPQPHPSEPDAGMRSIPCPASTPDLRIGLTAMGREGLMQGRVVDADPIPAALNRNDWTVELLDAEGEPIDDAAIDRARPFMYSGHNHAGRNDPEVTQVDGAPATFEVAKLDLWMAGPWEIELNVSSASLGDDFISFPACNNLRR